MDAESDRHPATDREMLVELVRLHAEALRRMPWVQAGVAIGIGAFIIRHVDHTLFLAWSSLTVLVEIARARYASSVLSRHHDVDPRPVHLTFVVLAASSGAALGLGAVLFLPDLPVWDQALFATTMLAIPAAGVAVSQSSRFIVAAYATSILAPAGFTWCLLYPQQTLGGSILIGLMLAVLTLIGADGEKLLLRSVAIRHERDRLVRDLEARNVDVRAAMAEVHEAMTQAERSAQARARVLAAASHDLRQPLHALSVYSAVLNSRPAPDLLHEVSGNIDQIVRALGNLLNGLLDLSRLSAGYYVPEQQNISLDIVIAAVCAECRHPATQKGLSLTQELAPLRLLGDPVAIGRIARNLLDNAIKYTEVGGVRVTIHAEVRDGAPLVILSVIDTGRGIPVSEHERVFEEFYQLDNPGRDRSKGVGLGLAIVQRLCELIGATISVESTVGEGSCFRVAIPGLSGSAAETEAAALPLPSKTTLLGKRVYVVDDETDILRSMRTLMGVWGIRCLTADSSTAAERVFSENGVPDLLIVDLRIGESEHGARLADRMRRDFGDFSVLIITGETSSEALRQANESGYTILQKPIAPEVLHRAIAMGVTGTHTTSSENRGDP